MLPKEVFDVKMNQDLVHQVVLAQTAARRRSIAKVKDRSEVRGGGKKPWRQKGTGRARHGSIRSPIWKGGGVTFGPNPEKVYKQHINKKMRRKALTMILSSKAADKTIFVLDDLKISGIKTKLMAEILKKLSLTGSGLVLLAEKDETIVKSTRNIPGFKPMLAQDLNPLDLVSRRYLLMPKEAIKVIKKTIIDKAQE